MSKNRQEIQWETLAVFVAKDPTPRVFPAVQISVRHATRYDKSYKDTVTYTRGHVDSRDDHTGKTFHPIMHTPDRLMLAYIRLEQEASSHVAVLANNADKQAYGKLAAPLGLVASHKGR